VLTLSKFADKVLLVNKDDTLDMEVVIHKMIDRKENVDILLNTEVVAFSGEEDIEALVVQSAEGQKMEIPIDGVFMGVGWDPNVGMLDIPVEKDEKGYIKTDAKLMTSFPGLFAAGDVRDTDLRQVITACADGARVAKYASDFLEEIH
jgi:thioredoxin reductase (NADPH)